MKKTNTSSKSSMQTSLLLAKQNFKFSVAHFLIFNATEAEKLHGHNYRVKVRLGLPNPETFAKSGYFIDFNVFKKAIRKACDEWDEHVLLPAEHPEMKTSVKGESLEVRFRDRFYVFPKNEVILLPVTNTSVEQISRVLAERLGKEFAATGLRSLEVYVEETAGQGASHKILFS